MEEKAQRASVVIPTHHGAHRLPALLDALVAQDLDEPWDVVAVVDGVVDHSQELLARYADRLRLTVIVHEAARGVVPALNAGFSEATGEILIRCDDDLTPAPDCVRRHLAHHAGRTDVGVIGPTLDVFPDTPYAIAYGQRANRRAVAAALARPPEELWISWAAHNSLHRDAWAASGGYDPSFDCGEDSEFGYRLMRQGVHLVVDPDLVIPHRGPATLARTRVPRAFVAGASRRHFRTVHPEALPPPPAPRGRARLWAALVGSLAAAVRTPTGFARVGRAVDAALPLLPRSVGGKVAALAVEAAGASGERHGSSDMSAYQARKVAEIAAELGSGGE